MQKRNLPLIRINRYGLNRGHSSVVTQKTFSTEETADKRARKAIHKPMYVNYNGSGKGDFAK